MSGGGDSFLFIEKKTMYWYSYIVYPEYLVFLYSIPEVLCLSGGGDSFLFIQKETTTVIRNSY